MSSEFLWEMWGVLSVHTNTCFSLKEDIKCSKTGAHRSSLTAWRNVEWPLTWPTARTVLAGYMLTSTIPVLFCSDDTCVVLQRWTNQLIVWNNFLLLLSSIFPAGLFFLGDKLTIFEAPHGDDGSFGAERHSLTNMTKQFQRTIEYHLCQMSKPLRLNTYSAFAVWRSVLHPGKKRKTFTFRHTRHSKSFNTFAPFAILFYCI